MPKTHPAARPPLFVRAARLAVTASFAAAVMPLAAQPALALDLDLPELDTEAIDSGSAFGWATAPAAATYAEEAESSLPAAFDMRDKGWITPVKFQNPWGTCWSFGATAAAESSIRSELMQAGAPQELIDRYADLSERHLAWFAYTPVPDGTQAGEGGHNIVAENSPDVPDPDHAIENAVFDSGGNQAYATSLYSSGIGPVYESQAPYRNDEGLINKVEYEGAKVPYAYSKKGTWALSRDLQFKQVAELEETYVLPEPLSYEPGSEAWEAALDAIKGQLMEGRAVSMCFYADTSKPDQVTEENYLNPGNNGAKAWAHYTFEEVGINHAVTIVGWDDDFAAENFGNPDPETGKVDPATQPAGDGAWIVKNSWGAEDAEFPNRRPGGWGTDEDGDGKGDGYFYLSYYDKTMCRPEALNFDTASFTGHSEQYVVDAYDYMPSYSVLSMPMPGVTVKTANVFTAERDQLVRTLTCETSLPDTSVTYEVYRMPEGEAWDWDRAELVLTKSAGDPYEFGGFHRTELSEDERVAVREGQMYAVVARMHCESTEQDYYRLEVATSKKYRDETMYPAMLESAIAEKAAEFMKKDASLSEADATERATTYWTEEATQAERDALAPTYFEGVINEGESYLYMDGAWEDWKNIADLYEQVSFEGKFEMDNPPLKAYAEIADFADAEELAALEDAVKDARSLLERTAESADGKNVARGEKWATAEARAAFAEAIAAAEEALAVDDAEATDIEAAADALAEARAEFEGTLRDGAKAEAGKDEPGDSGKDDPGKGGSGAKDPAAPKGDLPQTGDASLAAGVVAALSGGGVAALGAIFRRRRR